MKTQIALLAAALALTACSATSTYQRVPATGRFRGEPRMVALAPNTFFFFQPRMDQQFSFTTHRMADPALAREGGRGRFAYRKEWKIEPGEMITTGASVPRSLWYLPGFAAFDFTRAALIHDWLYEAHHRYERASLEYAAAKKKGKVEDMRRLAGELKLYKDYAKITQNDAADIFAECIKVTMEECKEILEGIEQLSADGGEKAQGNLAGLKAALRYNRPHHPTLWAYHYFVSDDCAVATSRKVWGNHGTDVDLYKLLTTEPVRSHALDKGYVSRWLMERFDRILLDQKKRSDRYERAKRTMGITQMQQQPAPPANPPAPAAGRTEKRGPQKPGAPEPARSRKAPAV